MNIWPWYELWLEAQLKKLSYSLNSVPPLSKAILALSDIYQSKNVTPWENKQTTAAYLAYFLPLNLIRAQAVFEILKTQGPPLPASPKILDFGSGAGTTELSLLLSGIQQASVEFVEISSVATQLHQSLHQEVEKNYPHFKIQTKWSQTPTNRKYDIGIFQTSLNELQVLPEILQACETLVIIEPATCEKARPMMELRQRLINVGYSLWAPCTHQQACPLLVESKRDWCHDRIFPELPPWFDKFLPHLPIENAELTFSYLVASQIPKVDTQAQARVVGEAQFEKGKVRQMICRGEKREFLSWLRRHGDPVTPLRGDLINAEEWPDMGNGEIRRDGEVEKIWSRPLKKI